MFHIVFCVFVVYLYVSRVGSVTSVGDEGVSLSVFVCLYFCDFCSGRGVPLPLGAWVG